MADFLLCFNAIMPLLLLTGLGFLLKRIRFISDESFAALDKLCFKIFIPVMLFSNVYHSDFSLDFDLKAVVYMQGALIVTFVLSFILIPRIVKGSNELKATLVHAFVHGNLAVLGLPLIQNLFGAEQTAAYSIMVACYSPIINPLMVYEHVYFGGDKLSPGKMARDVLKSPFLIGTLLGLACNLLRLQFPAFLNTAIANVKAIASPLCLIALGGSFKLVKGDKETGYAIMSVLFKCVVIPAFIMAGAVALGFRGIILASMMIVFCSPCATATYSFCTGYCGKPGLAAQCVVLSTLFSMFSLFAWLLLFMKLGLF